MRFIKGRGKEKFTDNNEHFTVCRKRPTSLKPPPSTKNANFGIIDLNCVEKKICEMRKLNLSYFAGTDLCAQYENCSPFRE